MLRSGLLGGQFCSTSTLLEPVLFLDATCAWAALWVGSLSCCSTHTGRVPLPPNSLSPSGSKVFLTTSVYSAAVMFLAGSPFLFRYPTFLFLVPVTKRHLVTPAAVTPAYTLTATG